MKTMKRVCLLPGFVVCSISPCSGFKEKKRNPTLPGKKWWHSLMRKWFSVGSYPSSRKGSADKSGIRRSKSFTFWLSIGSSRFSLQITVIDCWAICSAKISGLSEVLYWLGVVPLLQKFFRLWILFTLASSSSGESSELV